MNKDTNSDSSKSKKRRRDEEIEAESSSSDRTLSLGTFSKFSLHAINRLKVTIFLLFNYCKLQRKILPLVTRW